MIKSAIVAMTLLGCDCDAKVCTYIGESPQQWDSVTSCEASMKAQVLARSNLDYPLVTAECRPLAGEPAIIEVKSGTPVATMEPEAERIAIHASGGTVATFRQTAFGYEIVKSGISDAADALLARASSAISTTAGWLRY